jgi:hypothetical protein
MRRQLLLALVGLGAASGCGGGAPPGGVLAQFLSLNPTPDTISPDGQISVLHLQGFADVDAGTPGQCDVALSALPGTLNGSFSPIQVVLDASGAGQANYACDANLEPNCQGAATITANCGSRLSTTAQVFFAFAVDGGFPDAGAPPPDSGVLVDAG